MAAKRKRKSAPMTKKEENSRKQIYAVVLFAVALFLMFLVFIPGENIWFAIHNFMFGVFGVTAYFYPFVLGLIAVLLALDKTTSSVGAKVAESVILVMLIGGAIDILGKHAEGTFWQHLSSAYQIGVTKKWGWHT